MDAFMNASGAEEEDTEIALASAVDNRLHPWAACNPQLSIC